jgi:hypothetical protein
MTNFKARILSVATTAVFAGGAAALVQAAPASEKSSVRVIETAALRSVGHIDTRFLSYNVEAVEVTGGNFWAPYPKQGEAARAYDQGPHGAGFATDAYRKREPIDLVGNSRLQMLTRALGPAYMRVSGTWANGIYFQDNDEPQASPPAGYEGVLTRKQWAGVVAFAKAVDAQILTSFATSDGARLADGRWDPTSARKLFAYTKELGGSIAAVELTNEPNVRQKLYDPQIFAADQASLRSLVSEDSPRTLIVGPGSTGEAGFKLFPNPPEAISTARLLSGTPSPKFDAFSYHFYGAVSQRCKSLGTRDPKNIRDVTTSSGDALAESWLGRADQAQMLYRKMRDRLAPGAPIWITETAQTACGGDPWSATFLDTFRFLDQLGRFARQDVSVIFHNTLAASDYALIDDETWQPRPNYWGALLWRRLMGETVLDAGDNTGDLHLYAHCLRGRPGGIALLAVNLGRAKPAAVKLPRGAEQYLLSAAKLEGGSVELNGKVLALDAAGALPTLAGKQVRAGMVNLAPLTISFFAVPQAQNAACR